MPRLLIVDDFVDFPELIKSKFSNHKEFKIDVATSGVEALKLLPENCIDHQCYDLIIIDFAMPEMDGLTCAKRIRDLEKHLNWENTSIIFFTAYLDMTRVSSSILNDLNAKVWNKDEAIELVEYILGEFTLSSCIIKALSS